MGASDRGGVRRDWLFEAGLLGGEPSQFPKDSQSLASLLITLRASERRVASDNRRLRAGFLGGQPSYSCLSVS